MKHWHEHGQQTWHVDTKAIETLDTPSNMKCWCYIVPHLYKNGTPTYWEKSNAYSIKKSTKAITKGYFHHSCIWIRILINYNYRSWDGISDTLISILFSKPRVKCKFFFSVIKINKSTADAYSHAKVAKYLHIRNSRCSRDNCKSWRW
jgi:hypothetical protein